MQVEWEKWTRPTYTRGPQLALLPAEGTIGLQGLSKASEVGRTKARCYGSSGAKWAAQPRLGFRDGFLQEMMMPEWNPEERISEPGEGKVGRTLQAAGAPERRPRT